LLIKKEYKSATLLFKDLIEKYPQSRFASMSLAWAMGAYNDIDALESQRDYLQKMQYHKNNKVSNKAILWRESLESFSGNKAAAEKVVNSVDINDLIGVEIRLNWADNLTHIFDDAESADLVFDEILSKGVSESVVQVIDDIKRDSTSSEELNKSFEKDDETEQIVPDKYHLANAYPNPFNPKTTIEYALPRLSSVTMSIFNILGQKVISFVIPSQAAGIHQITWDSKNNLGGQVPSGLYIIRFTATSLEDTPVLFVKFKKVMLLK